MKVRLAGITLQQDMRRWGSKRIVHSEKARQYLAGLLLNKIVRIRAYGSDMENRVVAELYLNGRNINLEMVRAGFAEVFSGGLYRELDLEPYRRAEQEARKAGRGMWALDGR